MKIIRIEIEDGIINSIGHNNGWITFKSDDGDEIILEAHTLMRGIAIAEIDNKNKKPCSYCKNLIPDSGVFGLPTYTDKPENHKSNCPIREIMETKEQ